MEGGRNRGEGSTAKAGASRARTPYRVVKGADADTGPLPKAEAKK